MRYSCRFDDGEYICSFNQLKDAKKITLANYYNTVQEQDEASIDHEWYYKQLKSFGF